MALTQNHYTSHKPTSIHTVNPTLTKRDQLHDNFSNTRKTRPILVAIINDVAPATDTQSLHVSHTRRARASDQRDWSQLHRRWYDDSIRILLQ